MSTKTLDVKNNLTLEDLNCKEELINLLYYLYKNDFYFPRSCGAVSTTLACILQDKNVKDLYNIKYVRGHYRNDYEEFQGGCYVLDEDACVNELDYNRYSNLTDFECYNCSCDYMVGHSWIELESTDNSEESIILDFTSIQFEEDFDDYYNELLEDKFDKNELFTYLKDRSHFIVYSNDLRYENYLKSERELTGEYIHNTVARVLQEDRQSDTTILLEAINYKLSY